MVKVEGFADKPLRQSTPTLFIEMFGSIVRTEEVLAIQQLREIQKP